MRDSGDFLLLVFLFVPFFVKKKKKKKTTGGRVIWNWPGPPPRGGGALEVGVKRLYFYIILSP